MVAVTQRAQTKLRNILDDNGQAEAAVRVCVIRGPHGCVHGWQLAVEPKKNADDMVVTSGGVQLLVQPDLIEALQGANIDYREDDAAIGFTIDAPQAAHVHEHGGGCCH